MELLRNLIENTDATHMWRDRQAHLGNAGDSRCDEIYFARLSRAKIDLHRLPGPRLVLNRNFDAHRVCQFHLVNLWFHAKSKGVEPQLQDLFEFADTFCPIADKPESKSLVVRAARAKRSSIATPPLR